MPPLAQSPAPHGDAWALDPAPVPPPPQEQERQAGGLDPSMLPPLAKRAAGQVEEEQGAGGQAQIHPWAEQQRRRRQEDEEEAQEQLLGTPPSVQELLQVRWQA